MEPENLLTITDTGKRHLKLMVETYKAKKGNPDWFVMTDLVAQTSGVSISKDTLYRTSIGVYVSKPDPLAIKALALLPDFTFLDSDRHPSMDEIMDVLLGLLDAYGRPLERTVNNGIKAPD